MTGLPHLGEVLRANARLRAISSGGGVGKDLVVTDGYRHLDSERTRAMTD